MSADTNGHRDDGGIETAVTYDELDEQQLSEYSERVEQGARFLRDGLGTLEDMSPVDVLDDAEKPAESLVETFKEDVEQTLPELNDRPRDRQQDHEDEQKTTTDPEEIDWMALWNNAGIEPPQPLSGTQLALAIDVSNQTPVSDEGASNLMDRAVQAGVLQYYHLKRRYAPVGGGGR